MHHSRARKGGEIGANGEFYKGGAFINTVPENAKGSAAAKRKPLGKREVAPRVWEVQPFEGAIALFPQLSGVEIFNRTTGKFSLNQDLRGEQFASDEAIARRTARIEAYNSGKRWV